MLDFIRGRKVATPVRRAADYAKGSPKEWEPRIQNRNRCEPDTVTSLPARYAISYARLPRSGAAVVSRGCPEVSDGSDSTGNFAVRVEACQFGERT